MVSLQTCCYIEYYGIFILSFRLADMLCAISHFMKFLSIPIQSGLKFFLQLINLIPSKLSLPDSCNLPAHPKNGYYLIDMQVGTGKRGNYFASILVHQLHHTPYVTILKFQNHFVQSSQLCVKYCVSQNKNRICNLFLDFVKKRHFHFLSGVIFLLKTFNHNNLTFCFNFLYVTRCRLQIGKPLWFNLAFLRF